MFTLLGTAILIIGLSLLFENQKSDIEHSLMYLFLLSGVFMIYGGIQNVKKAKQKDAAVNAYHAHIMSQIGDQKSGQSMPMMGPTEADPSAEIEAAPPSDTYKPDIIAHWHYSLEEWLFMTSSEVRRRLKEGIWVSLFIGAIGGFILYKFRGANFFFGCLFALAIGALVSWLKISVAKGEFRRRKENEIIFTTNALLINGVFKTIQSNDIQLEYVKKVESGIHTFLEFSLQWMTRKGVTNDQIRILVPQKYQNEIGQILDYYSKKGVKTEGE